MVPIANSQSQERTERSCELVCFQSKAWVAELRYRPAMPTQHTREILSGPLTGAYLESKAGEGWKAVAVIWEREVPTNAPPLADIAQPVPYGLKIAEDCVALEQDMQEREALLAMLEMIIQDKPLREIAEELNARGFLTRAKSKWTPGTVFDMLPRLIEVGPRVFSTQEWVMRRGKLMNVS
jgi:hypothetical protein